MNLFLPDCALYVGQLVVACQECCQAFQGLQTYNNVQISNKSHLGLRVSGCIIFLITFQIRHTFYRVVSGLTPPPPWIIIPVRNQPRVCVLKAILWFNLFLNTSPVLFRSCESLSECLTFLNLTNSGLADLTGIRHLKKPLKHCIFSRTRVGQSNLQYSGDSTQYSGELLQYSTAGSQYLYPH